jgi:hypothetical protein
MVMPKAFDLISATSPHGILVYTKSLFLLSYAIKVRKGYSEGLYEKRLTEENTL